MLENQGDHWRLVVSFFVIFYSFVVVRNTGFSPVVDCVVLLICVCTMNDIKGRRFTLGTDEKHKYCQEAAALRHMDMQRILALR
ncbi:hypothetical protein QQF64_036129 [Cirrhinus molitorella]|uniref:Uncharacterized protein n=1 Tax=Cirrhinus molitorella TaxID=172907 RepID=A0ABR3NHP8_9TELE